MTRDRRRKQATRKTAATTGDRYTRARRAATSPPGASIRNHTGEMFICTACGQPAYDSTTGPHHFTEQDGGVFCPAFPAAAGLLRMDWDISYSLDIVKDEYPWPSVSANPECGHHHRRDQFRDFTGQVFVCSTCGQPAFEGEYGPQHFTDQWDGVFCSWFPLAGDLVAVNWHPRSLAEWKAGYPCSYPHLSEPPGR